MLNVAQLHAALFRSSDQPKLTDTLGAKTTFYDRAQYSIVIVFCIIYLFLNTEAGWIVFVYFLSRIFGRKLGAFQRFLGTFWEHPKTVKDYKR